MSLDDRTERNIATLLPPVQGIARSFIQKLVDEGFEAKIISGTRTYTEQDELYAKGRTAPGRIITNARGGFSNHNFGVAFDIGLFRHGVYLEESPQYVTASKYAKPLGLDWGGDWRSFQDEPHYEVHPAWAAQLTESQRLAEYRRRHSIDQDLFA